MHKKLLLSVATAFIASTAVHGQDKATPEQLTLGKTTYMTICIACHQANGAGLPNVFPSLVKSDIASGSPRRLAAMVLKGINPPFTYNGTTYMVPMTAQEAMLDDAKIAAALTYVRSNFDNNAAPVTPEFVAAVRKEFIDRKTPWTEAELKGWTDPAGSAPAAAPASK